MQIQDIIQPEPSTYKTCWCHWHSRDGVLCFLKPTFLGVNAYRCKGLLFSPQRSAIFQMVPENRSTEDPTANLRPVHALALLF